MGLFHDTCEAFVDLRNNGRALSGEDLRTAQELVFPQGATAPLVGEAREKALAAHGWGICGHEVPKKARVCSKCGTLAPKGYVKCPSCREWVGNESRFCPHCNHPLHPDERIDFAGGIWDRHPGLFAQRFELDDVSQIVKGGLKIQEGTLAILLDAGKKVAVLGPGRHRPEGTLRSINWFGNPPPRSVVMVDAGDCLFKMLFAGMRTAEELPVQVVAEITLRFDVDHADLFLANVLKESRAMATDAISGIIVAEATSAVKDLCAASTVEDLVKDPDRRARFQDAISRSLQDLFKRSGLELIRVGFVEFVSPAYEKLRQANGDLEVKRREVEFARTVRNFTFDKDKEEWTDGKAKREFGNERERDSAEDNLAMREFRLGIKKRSNIIRSDSEKEDAEAEKAHLDLEAQTLREKAQRKRDLEDYFAQLAQEKQLGSISRQTQLGIASLTAPLTVEDEVQRKKAENERHRTAERFEKEYDDLRHQFKKVDLEADIERAKQQNRHKWNIAEAEHANVLSGIKGKGELEAVILESKKGSIVDQRRIDSAITDDKVADIKRGIDRKDAHFLDETLRMDIDTKDYGQQKALDQARRAAELGRENLAFVQSLEAKERRERADTMKGMTYAEMAAMADDPAERAQYLEMARLEKEQEHQRAALSSQVDLAKIQASVQVAQVQGQTEASKAQAQAQAAAAAAQAQVAVNDRTLEELKKVMGDRADHDEKVMKMMQELAGKAIEKPTTVVSQAAPAQVVIPNTTPQPINIVK